MVCLGLTALNRAAASGNLGGTRIASVSSSRSDIPRPPRKPSSMKITLLAYVEEEGSREHDVVMGQVADALKEKGHEPSILCVHDDIQKMIAGLRRREPDFVFNLLEEFANDMQG